MPSEWLGYAAIAAVQMMAGVSVLAALRVRVDPEVRLLLGPAALQAVWACVFSLAVVSNVPVRAIAPFVWGGTLLLAAAGLVLSIKARSVAVAVSTAPGWTRARMVLLPAACAVLGLLALAPYLGQGLTASYRGSGVPDGWSYVAVSQFLWSHGQETAVQGLSLLHRYGTAFAHQRHVSSAELGVLSWTFAPGETQMAAGLLQALSVWALAMSSAAFARLRGHTPRFAAATAALVALSGWIANVVWLSNYDHSLSLTFAPALMALAISAEGMSVGGAVALGLLAAGTMHTYPELSVVVLGTTAAAYAVQAWYDGQIRRRVLLAPITMVVAAVLVGSYWPDYIGYLRYQSTVRPALAILHGLVEPRFMPSAFWALGGEHRVPLLLIGQHAVAALLFGVLAYGGVRLARRGDWALLAALVLFLGGAGFGMTVWQYGYGTYKVILSAWWLIAYTLVLAAASTAGATPREAARAVTPLARARQALLAAILLAIPGAVLVRDIVVVPTKQPQPMANLRVLTEVPRIIGREPVALLVDNLDATAWALYFLRDLPGEQTRLGDFSGYLAAPHLRARVEPSAAVPWDRIRYVLTDPEDRGPVIESRDWQLVWRKGAYALWDTGGKPWAVVTDVQHGDEVVGPPLPGVPMSAALTHLTLLASSCGRLRLVSTAAHEPSVVALASRLQGHCEGVPAVSASPQAPQPGPLPVPAPIIDPASLAIGFTLSPGETRCTLRLVEDATQARDSSVNATLGRMEGQWEPGPCPTAAPTP